MRKSENCYAKLFASRVFLLLYNSTKAVNIYASLERYTAV